MRKETRERIRTRFEVFAKWMRDRQEVEPELVIREVEAVPKILAQIEEDGGIGLLVLGASADMGGPGLHRDGSFATSWILAGAACHRFRRSLEGTTQRNLVAPPDRTALEEPPYAISSDPRPERVSDVWSFQYHCGTVTQHAQVVESCRHGAGEPKEQSSQCVGWQVKMTRTATP